MANPRRAYVTVEYDGKDITEQISNSIISFSYTDKASDEADDISLTLHDREGHWHNEWYPKTKSKSSSS